MPGFLRILINFLLIPTFLIGFTVVHEMGHTILARMLGDPASTFYLAKIEEDSACLGRFPIFTTRKTTRKFTNLPAATPAASAYDQIQRYHL